MSYNSARDLPALLDSIPGALDGLTGRTVVVDNGSSDESAALVGARSDTELISSANHGYAAAINLGADHLGEVDALVVLNPDLVLHPGSIRRMAERLGDQIGVVGPAIRDSAGEQTWSIRRDPAILRACGLGRTGRPLLSEYVRDGAAYRSAHAVDWLLGACLAISAQCRRAVGAWDESFFLYSEETDYCQRARDLGWEVWFEPAAAATHAGGGSGTSTALHEMQVINRIRLVARRRGVAYGYGYLLATLVHEGMWAVTGHRRNRSAIRAILRPATRPPELGDTGFLPT